MEEASEIIWFGLLILPSGKLRLGGEQYQSHRENLAWTCGSGGCLPQGKRMHSGVRKSPDSRQVPWPLKLPLFTGPKAPGYTVKGGDRGAQRLLKGRASHSGARTSFRLEGELVPDSTSFYLALHEVLKLRNAPPPIHYNLPKKSPNLKKRGKKSLPHDCKLSIHCFVPLM